MTPTIPMLRLAAILAAVMSLVASPSMAQTGTNKLARAVDEVRAALADASDELDATDDALAELKLRTSAVDLGIQIGGNKKVLLNEIDSIRNEVAKVEDDLSRLGSKVSALRSQLEAIAADVRAAGAKSVFKAVSTAFSELHNVEERIEQQKHVGHQIRNELDELEDEISG